MAIIKINEMMPKQKPITPPKKKINQALIVLPSLILSSNLYQGIAWFRSFATNHHFTGDVILNHEALQVLGYNQVKWLWNLFLDPE